MVLIGEVMSNLCLMTQLKRSMKLKRCLSCGVEIMYGEFCPQHQRREPEATQPQMSSLQYMRSLRCNTAQVDRSIRQTPVANMSSLQYIRNLSGHRDNTSHSLDFGATSSSVSARESSHAVDSRQSAVSEHDQEQRLMLMQRRRNEQSQHGSIVEQIVRDDRTSLAHLVDPDYRQKTIQYLSEIRDKLRSLKPLKQSWRMIFKTERAQSIGSYYFYSNEGMLIRWRSANAEGFRLADDRRTLTQDRESITDDALMQFLAPEDVRDPELPGLFKEWVDLRYNKGTPLPMILKCRSYQEHYHQALEDGVFTGYPEIGYHPHDMPREIGLTQGLPHIGDRIVFVFNCDILRHYPLYLS